MAEQNQDLPLVVSEILIEMHDMKASINRMAEIMLNQQRETNKRFELLMEADRTNTTMIIEAFREEAGATRQPLDKIENRLAGLENK
ncbi:hypothetical protein KB206_04915 [Microvirga sp. STS02]|uniref:hypothetical protein n=1 Tax=Hymenobacter negativus TaxID=2795026 RepID=UPI0018DE7D27|nr:MULTISPECIES: hypothetical protein [Bacteria]MBH8568211.1 hypothetical protein [Hymenobacter negativus]MBR7207946.1 hypothetical protein [Microvirga sp. STS02]